MKLTAKVLFALFTVSVLVAIVTGCSTTGGSSDAARDEKVAASVEYAAQIATYAVLQDRPKDRKHFLTAADAIDSVVASGSLSPETIQDIVQATAADSPEAALAINGALVIYRIWWADYLKDEIAQSPTATKILTALAAGIRAGAAGPNGGTKGTLPPPLVVKLPSKALQDAYDAHVNRYTKSR
ncbi:MAG: hypothetical protein IT581_14050 [Verrucomicrobiales bacterium]|nr:hypothetical protein [Verrucomicrobiales bacterium]